MCFNQYVKFMLKGELCGAPKKLTLGRPFVLGS